MEIVIDKVDQKNNGDVEVTINSTVYTVRGHSLSRVNTQHIQSAAIDLMSEAFKLFGQDVKYFQGKKIRICDPARLASGIVLEVIG